MDTPSPRTETLSPLDRRGIALPLALLGLVAISIMVTAALLTSSTEAAISRAQTDATRDLYRVEGALQRYVQTRGAQLAPVANATYAPATGESYRVDVSRLFRDPPSVGGNGRAVYAVQVEPTAGGRTLVAMVNLRVMFLSLNINAGATLGNNSRIGGSIDINRGSNLCVGQEAGQAILHAAGTTLTMTGQAARNIGNDTATFAGGRDSLAKHTLNGIDLWSVAQQAHVKFGRMFPSPDSLPFSGSPSATNSNPKLRWGCPPDMVTGCPAGSDTVFKLVAIDAANADGSRGEVRIQGDYGQGLLVVLNGDLRITGGFRYKGIILVEGNTDIHGGSGGSGGAKIEGALLGLGDLEICQNNTSGECENSFGEGDGSDLSSGAVIQYNRCAINAVQNSINNTPIQERPRALTFGWFELVR